jgi:hypothetical protein
VGEARHTLLLHRLLLSPPEGLVCDHVNGDGLDNRRANLRVCTFGENLMNTRLYRNSTTGLKGVTKAHLDRFGAQRYRAQIQVRGVPHSLGCFGSATEAAKTYDRAALKHFGEFAVTNFPRSNYR